MSFDFKTTPIGRFRRNSKFVEILEALDPPAKKEGIIVKDEAAQVVNIRAAVERAYPHEFITFTDGPDTVIVHRRHIT